MYHSCPGDRLRRDDRRGRASSREATQAALARLKETGRKLILVTGRELADLERVFPGIDIFDKIVAENGAILYTPASKEQRVLAPSPSAEFVARLQARGVAADGRAHRRCHLRAA